MTARLMLRPSDCKLRQVSMPVLECHIGYIWSAGVYAASAPTLQCAPSESTNYASTPPKSCFFGSMLKSTPFALISR
jgi:hypothetical protein